MADDRQRRRIDELERRRSYLMAFPDAERLRNQRRRLAEIESGTEKFRDVFTQTRLRDVDDLLKYQILLTTYEDAVAMAIADRLGLDISNQLRRAAQRVEEEARRQREEDTRPNREARHELQDD